MSRAECIKNNFSRVLEERKAKADEVRRKKAELEKITDEALKRDSESYKNSTCDFKMAPRDLYREAHNVNQLLDEYLIRLSRKYISIPFIGMPRQGKTVALLSLAGLDKLKQINFTVGLSLFNDCTMKPGKVKFKLSFYSKEEFVEIVKDCVRKISEEYLNEHDISFDDIEYISIPMLEAGVSVGDYKNHNLEKLRKIVDGFNTDTQAASLKNIIGKMPITVNDISEANKYIGLRSMDYSTFNLYSAFLGVSNVEIFCCFPEDIGNVVISDKHLCYDCNRNYYVFTTDREEPVESYLKREADGAVVVRRPMSGVRDEDLNFYEAIERAFKEADASKWLFYIAAAHRFDDPIYADTFVKEMKCTKVDAYKADCSEGENIWQDAFFPILETLSQNLTEIDSIYMQQIDEAYEKVINKFKSFWEE